MIKTQEITVNLGPQHPSTHGVYRCILNLDGEYITNAENVIGYLHRGLEKIAEAKTYTQFIPFTDRLDYLSGCLNNLGYVQTIEKLMGLEKEIPERAEYIRVIMSELQRIASHLVFVGCYALDLAGFTGWMYTFRDREKVLDLIEAVTGSRMTTSYMRVGGVAEDLPEGFLVKLKELMDEMPKLLDEYDGLISGNEILQARSKNVGIVSAEMAVNYGWTGPNLRASGVNFDLRKAQPYSIYDRFDFEVPVLHNGDTFDRYFIRVLEMRQSVRIIQQALEQIPEGPIMAKVPKVLKPPVGEVYHQIEVSKGLEGFHLVSDGSTKPYRLHIRTPSFINLGLFPECVKGYTIQDGIAILAAIDIVLGEVDR
jgi:NADH-quinone oxidoreductase subunit D